jgi:hypothetical protein
VPDATWTAFSPVAAGNNIGGSSRYLQYRAELTSNPAAAAAPTLGAVSISYWVVLQE